MNRFVPNLRAPGVKALIAEASRKVFENLPVVNYRTGNKFLKQKPIGPLIVDYYAENLTKSFRKVSPGFLTEQAERRLEKLQRLKRRGKGPPKKGMGKRAQKAAKKK